MPVSFIQKYLVKKLDLTDETEVSSIFPSQKDDIDLMYFMSYNMFLHVPIIYIDFLTYSNVFGTYVLCACMMKLHAFILRRWK